MMIENNIKKITIISNNVCYGHIPENNEIIKQRLTILNGGRIYLYRYIFHDILVKEEIFSISRQKSEKIIHQLVNYFNTAKTSVIKLDGGLWNIIMTAENGKQHKINGSICNDTKFWYHKFSKIVRKTLNRDYLFVLDGDALDYDINIGIIGSI